MQSEKIKGYAKGLVISGAVAGANIVGVETAHAESSVNEITSELDNYDKAYLSLLITSATTAAALFGYRMADGARNLERQAWKYAVPGTAITGASMLLGRIWGVV